MLLNSSCDCLDFMFDLEGSTEHCVQEVLTDRILVSGYVKSANKHELIEFDVSYAGLLKNDDGSSS